MDSFANNGRVNQFQSLANDYHWSNAIRSAMIQKRETLKRIKREIAQLVEKEKQIEDDLAHLSIELAPHNSCPLPNEILSHVFILVVQDYGPVHFPIPKTMEPPPQFAISQVCSHWRRVALRTFELWSNTHLTYPEGNRNIDQTVYIRHWRRWLMRAVTLPVRLSIEFCNSLLDNAGGIANVLQMFLLPFRVKKLHLSLTYKDLVELSTLPEAMLLDLVDLSLDLTLPDDELDTINMDNPHHFITRLRSLTFYGDEFNHDWLVKLSPAFPWSQLQSLNFEAVFVEDLHPLIEVLRQTPKLQMLNLEIYKYHIDALQVLTFPSLRDLSLMVGEDVDGTDLIAVMHGLTCPSLIKLKLCVYGWAVGTFEIIERQYNMQGLEEIEFARFPLSISSILENAPMLRTLSVQSDAVLDDAAIIGLSSGTLGRFLTNLNLGRIDCDVNEVAGIVETRMRTVNALIGSGCSWREDITILKDVMVSTRRDGRDEQRESGLGGVIAKLREAGINITVRPQ